MSNFVHKTIWIGFKPDVLCKINSSCKGTENAAKVTCKKCLKLMKKKDVK